MSDNDLIRRGDAIALFDAPNILEDLRAIPAADPLADPRVQALVEAEREAIAVYCETHAVQSVSPSAIPTPMGDAGWSHVGMKYAAAIRARKGRES